ncbi:hypothetical protein OQA88_2912 [Cercophora sp. LCS_1]
MAPHIKTGSGKGKPKKVNPVRRIMNREENSRERRTREASVAGSVANSAGLAAGGRRFSCPNKTCKNPRVEDGTCQTCGAVASETNIVAEVTFGEASNGAAVVQGNFVAADQGGVRPSGSGYAFRRVAGSGNEARERTLRDVKSQVSQWVHHMRLPLNLVESAMRTYKIAAMNNFVQGRRTANVAAICLYAECRKESSNRVMLIDFADILKVDVFLLGRDYKNLLSRFPNVEEGTRPIIYEDLIFRFASKLEFYNDTNRVAESAVRIAARMRKDNITHGRRPAGVCGAAIILAARAHNYRRTVREVVYIAKVTEATITERMQEFANVPSAQMTISDFHENDFLESSHDPPFVYKQTDEWKEKHGKSRKRKARDVSADNASGTTTTAPNVDKDGFVVPPIPQRATASGSARDEEEEAVIASGRAVANGDSDENEENMLAALAGGYGDEDDEESEDDLGPTSEMAMAAAQGIVKMPVKKRKNNNGTATGIAEKNGKKTLNIDAAWEADEKLLEEQMKEHLHDPRFLTASDEVAEETRAQEAAAQAAAAAKEKEKAAENAGAETNEATDAQENAETEPEAPAQPVGPPKIVYYSEKYVCEDAIVHEDEFKDDPEVEFCRLGEEEARVKELIWANHNKEYMRHCQQKIFESKMNANGPPKQRRNRTKKPRIGEGQAGPAESAEEAAINMMRVRGVTTKLDYTKLGQVFDLSKTGPGSTGGTNSVASRSVAPSEGGSESEGDEEAAEPVVRGQASSSGVATTMAPSTSGPAAAAGEDEDEEVEEEENGEEVVEPEEEEAYGQGEFDPFASDNDGEDYDE